MRSTTHAIMKQRLNKLIAQSGICSRRKADELIERGSVRVNNTVVTALGMQVDPRTDSVTVNGRPLAREKNIYLILNKPKGYITTAADRHAEKTVFDLLRGIPQRVFPVGRLDKLKPTSSMMTFLNSAPMITLLMPIT